VQNLRGNLLDDIERLQRRGIDVQVGMIVGFDHDDHSTFARQLEFLTQARVPICFPGMLQAPEGTALRARLLREGRIRDEEGGDHGANTNIVPAQMDALELKRGFRWLLGQLYDERRFAERAAALLPLLPPPHETLRRYVPREGRSLQSSLAIIGRLLAYYGSHGPATAAMLLRFAKLLGRYPEHAELIFSWLVLYKHFREWVRARGGGIP
jgi:hypothetical protein